MILSADTIMSITKIAVLFYRCGTPLGELKSNSWPISGACFEYGNIGIRPDVIIATIVLAYHVSRHAAKEIVLSLMPNTYREQLPLLVNRSRMCM